MVWVGKRTKCQETWVLVLSFTLNYSKSKALGFRFRIYKILNVPSKFLGKSYTLLKNSHRIPKTTKHISSAKLKINEDKKMSGTRGNAHLYLK